MHLWLHLLRVEHALQPTAADLLVVPQVANINVNWLITIVGKLPLVLQPLSWIGLQQSQDP